MEKATFLAAGQMFTELVARVPDDAWDRPALGEWDVRALVGHTARALTTVVDYLAQPARQEDARTPAEYVARLHALDEAVHAQVAERGVAAGARLGARPALAVRQILEDVAMALMTVAADQDPVITTVLGGMRLSSYLPTRTLELTAHSLDLAAALDLPLDVPTEVMATAVEVVAASAVANDQGAELLRALTGRAPLAEGFTVL